MNTKIKTGDKIYVEQAWEDGAGSYHDEIAKVVEINDEGKMRLKFEREDITNFLDGADFNVADYENCVVEQAGV